MREQFVFKGSLERVEAGGRYARAKNGKWVCDMTKQEMAQRMVRGLWVCVGCDFIPCLLLMLRWVGSLVLICWALLTRLLSRRGGVQATVARRAYRMYDPALHVMFCCLASLI